MTYLDPAATERLLDAVTAHKLHDEAVQHAAAVLATDHHPNLAQRLLDTWTAIGGGDPDADIRALPPEPPVGSTVEIIDGPSKGQVYTAITVLNSPTWRAAHRAFSIDWPNLLHRAGPAGVRVIEGGGSDGA